MNKYQTLYEAKATFKKRYNSKVIPWLYDGNDNGLVAISSCYKGNTTMEFRKCEQFIFQRLGPYLILAFPSTHRLG